MNAIFRQVRANLRSRKLQTVLIFLTLAASALLITTALTAYSSGQHLYDRLLERTHGAHLWFSAEAEAVSPDEVRQAVASLPGVEESTEPLATFGGVLIAPDGKKVGLLVRELEPGRTIALPLPVEGKPPSRPDELYLDHNVARSLDIEPGEQVRLLIQGEEKRFTVSGTFVTSEFCAYPGCQPARAYLAEGAFAEMGLDKPSAWDIGLRLDDPQQAEAALQALTKALPAGQGHGYTWLTIRRFVGFDVRLQAVFMLAFAVMAGLVGGFLIANAVSGAIRAQTRQIGLLRAIGFTDRQLAAIYLSEYLGIGLLASLLGMGLGVPLSARLFAHLSSRYAAGALLPPAGILLLTLAALLGLVALATLLPLRRIARLDTVTAIRQGLEPPRRRRVRLPRLPFPVAYGLTDLLATPGRTLLTALGIGVVALAIAVAITLAATIRSFADDPVGAGLVPDADLLVQVQGEVDDGALITYLSSSPEIAAFACQATRGVHLEGEENQALYPRFLCGDMSLFDNLLLEGRLPQAEDEVAAAYTIASDHGWRVGDEVTLLVEGKATTMRIVGLYRDTNNLGQMFIIPAQAFPELAPTSFFLRLKEGSDPHAVKAAIEQQFGDGVEVESLEEMLSNPDSGMDTGQMLRATVQVLSFLLSVIAAFGVMSSLSMSIQEGRREIGILKALGMLPSQVVAAVLTSAVAMAALGYLVGAPTGLMAGRRLLSLLGERVGLGPIAAPIDLPGLLALLPVLLGMAAVGALLPARAAARLPVIEVLREE